MEARTAQRANSADSLAPLRLDEVARIGSIAEQVFRTLRSSIVTLALRPATALSEQDIANRLKVSRQPVREAFIKLSEIGLVRVLPQRGTYVTKISAKEVMDARFVREAVECAIARRASAGIGKTAIDELRHIIGEQRKAARAKDEGAFFVLDDAFHRSLASAADCAYAWKIVEEAKGQMDRVRFLSIPDTMPTEVPIVQHQTILTAIEAGDAAEAERTMQDHLREILKTMPKLELKFPEMFANGPSITSARKAKRPAHGPGVVRSVR
jgi:DNA-binding GntR family transcriptional regulator